MDLEMSRWNNRYRVGWTRVGVVGMGLVLEDVEGLVQAGGQG